MPTLITSSLERGKSGELEEPGGHDQIARSRGRPRAQFEAERLSVPRAPGKGRSWLMGATQLETTGMQLQAGMYIKAWIEAQPDMPNLKQGQGPLWTLEQDSISARHGAQPGTGPWQGGGLSGSQAGRAGGRVAGRQRAGLKEPEQVGFSPNS